MKDNRDPHGAVPRKEPVLALTVDVEPDWGMSGSAAVRQTLPRLLELLDSYQARATFFMVAGLLKECADLLRSAAARHEIASHGLSHRRLDRMSEREVKLELAESRARLSDELGVEVSGFRAPFLRTAGNWFDLLAETGYRYDSSVGRVHPSPLNATPRRWKPAANGTIAELPTIALRTGWVPFSLTYLRLGAPFTEMMAPRGGGMFYFHLHEVASPSLLVQLRPPLRWLLRRNVGEPAWHILTRLLQTWKGRAVTCDTLLRKAGLLS